MREILFRGKRDDNGELVEGLFLPAKRGEATYIIPKQSVRRGTLTMRGHLRPDFIFYDVDPDTVSEFTGLYDKNGKRIFEGDIVKETSGNNIRLLGDKREIRSGIGVIEFGEYRTPSDDPFEWADAYGFYIFGGNVLYPTISMYPYKYKQYGEKEVVIELEVIGNKWDNPELLEKCRT